MGAETAISVEEELPALRARASLFGATPRVIRVSDAGSIRMAMMDYGRFEGELPAIGYLTLQMCTHGAASMLRNSAVGRLNRIMRPGSVCIALSNDAATVQWGASQMLAIGIDQEQLLNARVDRERLIAAATHIHDDPLLSSVLMALWREAEIHGLSSAFFEHGLTLVLNRLAELDNVDVAPPAARALSARQIKRLDEWLDARLDMGASVAEMAAWVGREASSFSHALRQATGFAPYQYLTYRRMIRAEDLLRNGQSVTEVAMLVGYANPSKFAAAFKRYRGVTPSMAVHGLDGA